MNNDLISREALKKEITDNMYFIRENNNQLIAVIKVGDLLKFIDNAPTVAKIDTNDIEYKAYCKGLEDGKKIARPQGVWEKIGEIGLAYKCNRCGEVEVLPKNFCPNCGAYMRKENDNGKS